MPSAKIPGALLNLYETEGQPWQWSTWQATTGLTAAPWSGAPGSLPSEWTQDDAAKVKAFVANYLAIPSSNWKRRAAYLKTSGKRGMKRKEALDDASVNSETDSDEEDSDAVGRKKWSLTKALRVALLQLASQDEIEAIRSEIISIVHGEPVEIQELNFNRAEVGHWREGVEEYANLTLDEVWDRLGLRDKVIPGFATLQDPDGTFDAWTKQGQAVLKGSKATLLTPRWHQLVGLLKLLDNLFLGKPMLLMDEVGIGKTMQAVGLCAMYDYARQYYVEHECFPGQWAKVKYPHTEDGNLPDRPMIISVPTSLVSQWTEEIHRYIAKGSMDLLPHAGTYSHRGDWWASVYAKSKHPPSRQIILTTHSAIASDCDAVFRINDLRARKGRRHGDVQYKATMGDDARKKTLYGHKYGVFIVDEAH
ncbi:predicted protein, partial [Postia placenta Mad-698-R]